MADETEQVPIEDQHPDEMAAELKVLRDEVELLRRRLEATPTRLRVLEERLLETKNQLSAATERNEKLVETLTAAREQLNALRDEVDKLSTPPQTFGTFVGADEEEGIGVVQAQGRKLRVGIGPDVDVAGLHPGRAAQRRHGDRRCPRGRGPR